MTHAMKVDELIDDSMMMMMMMRQEVEGSHPLKENLGQDVPVRQTFGL